MLISVFTFSVSLLPEEPSEPSTSHQEEAVTFEPQPSTSKEVEQTATLMSSSVMLEAENYFLRQQIQQQKAQADERSVQFSYAHVKNNDALVLLYTGLPNSTIFEALYELLKEIEMEYFYNWKVEKISKEDQLFITLMKLRQNFPHADLAQRFNVSVATISNIVVTWIHVMHRILFRQLMSEIPSRDKTKTCLPNCFSSFTNCRVILDCTEIYTAVPRSSMAAQKATYSTYKHRNTWKTLVGVAPNGVITFISPLYPGSTSDKKITQHSGILEQLTAGDLVLADKGFLIRDILPPGVHLNIPPFLSTPQFTPEQVKQTQCIARARIHVERAIRRMKSYKILDFIPQTLAPHAEKVCQVVGSLTNLQYPLLKEVQQYFSESID